MHFNDNQIEWRRMIQSKMQMDFTLTDIQKACKRRELEVGS